MIIWNLEYNSSYEKQTNSALLCKKWLDPSLKDKWVKYSSVDFFASDMPTRKNQHWGGRKYLAI